MTCDTELSIKNMSHALNDITKKFHKLYRSWFGLVQIFCHLGQLVVYFYSNTHNIMFCFNNHHLVPFVLWMDSTTNINHFYLYNIFYNSNANMDYNNTISYLWDFICEIDAKDELSLGIPAYYVEILITEHL